LGLPLSLKKLTKDQVQPINGRIADQLSGWKANLMTKIGGKVRYSLCSLACLSISSWLLIFLHGPSKQWIRFGVDFFGKGRRDAQGGHYLIAWVKVCQPIELGGLGITDLKSLGWALRMRWLWLQKTQPDCHGTVQIIRAQVQKQSPK
jgi:hypothetical protein